jgi:hypothetical protein
MGESTLSRLARFGPTTPKRARRPFGASVDPTVDPTDARNGNISFRDWPVRCHPPVVLP